jgi:hypothetical protein
LLLSHYADRAVLFTATPINRGATDLLGIIELLGADNLDDESLEVFSQLQRVKRRRVPRDDEKVVRIRDEVKKFVVRRTRQDLNRIADDNPDAYRLSNGRSARYPRLEPSYYACPATPHDLVVAAQMMDVADQLTGILRVGKVLELPRALALEGLDEASYLRRVVRSAHGLARHLVLDCLRSSRAALVEHAAGTEEAWSWLYPSDTMPRKQRTGDMNARSRAIAGTVPEWKFAAQELPGAPDWLRNPERHREECQKEGERYLLLAKLARQLSDQRERAKADHLARLGAGQLTIAFDSHLISLHVLERMLEARVNVVTFTGEGGPSAKRKAKRMLGLESRTRSLVALCSDMLSEGVNLQKASSIVHLDTPTVIRTAEQRAGRVDRMDSPHDTVVVWWPRDDEAFAPRKRDLLRERHEVVADLIGANLQLPDDDDASEVVRVEEIVRRVDEQRAEGVSTLYDAFRPVRALIGPGGLVPHDVYRLMRNSQAEVIAGVSVVESADPWAFVAVGANGRHAPRWVFLPSPEAEPVVDLVRIEEALRLRLHSDTPSLSIDENSSGYVARFIDHLRARERALLPVRRQRALRLAEVVLAEYARRDWHGDERHDLVRSLLNALHPDTSTDHADPRVLAESWLRVIRPRQQRALVRRRRRTPWRLDNLREDLIEDPLSNSELKSVVSDVPLLQPLGERIVAMIAGIPPR